MARLAKARLGILALGVLLVVLSVAGNLNTTSPLLKTISIVGVVLGLLLCVLGVGLVIGRQARMASYASPATGSGGRAGQIYSSIAVMTTNTLLMLALINLLIGAGYTVSRARQESQDEEIYRRYSDFFADVYPGYTADEIQQLLWEGWSRPPTCNPFTHFRERPIDGEYVDVSPVGYREVANQSPWPPDPDELTIFVFGGSTTFGYGVADEETIPSHLQAYLRVEEAEAHLYNFAQGAFFSSQELILFENLLREGVRPDVAIFVDGLNEFYSWNGIPEGMNTCGHELLQQGEEPFVLPMARLANDLRGRLSAAQEAASNPPPDLDDEAVNQAVIDRWFANKAMIEAVARAYGVEVLFVWQPVPTYHYDLAYHPMVDRNPASFALHARSAYGYPLMRDVLSEGGARTENILDLSDIQADRQERLYVDVVHYSPAFSEEIAGHIGEALLDGALLDAAQ